MTREEFDSKSLQDLDAADPEIDALSGEERAAVAAIWSARARSELTAARVFGALSAAAHTRPTAPNVSYLLTRAAADEVLHADICRRVASRYLGVEQPLPSVSPQHLPAFGNAAPALNTSLNIVINSCISETVAAEFLRECREEAVGVIVRRALRLLLRDEIDHARIGWAHLASPEVSALERGQVAQAVPALLRAAREAWSKSVVPHCPAAIGHGWFSDERVEAIFDEVVAEVIVPGFAHVGVHLNVAGA